MEYNKNGLIVLLGSVFISFVWFAYLVIFASPEPLAELDAVDTPSTAQVASEESKPQSTDEPWVESPALITQGEKTYQINCASCHGKTGIGDGIAAASLKPKPRNLQEGDWKQGGSSIALYKTLAAGIEGTSMVSFSYLSPAERWALVHYIRSITKNKVEDDLEKLKEFAKTAK